MNFFPWWQLIAVTRRPHMTVAMVAESLKKSPEWVSNQIRMGNLFAVKSAEEKNAPWMISERHFEQFIATLARRSVNGTEEIT